tara:strand:- start:3326 stop:3796 length:471 start_codon:yes stop_codon:yes gene_type:complete
MKNILIFILLLIFLSKNSFAEDKESLNSDINKKKLKAEYVLVKMKEDYISCYVFYTITAEGFRRSDEKKSFAKGLDRSAETSLKNIYEIGELLNLEIHKITNDIELEMESQSDEMGNRYINLSLIVDKYAVSCKDLIENKKKRINFWEKEAEKKFK